MSTHKLLPGLLFFLVISPTALQADVQFIRGDVTSDVTVDLADAVTLLTYLFVAGAPEPLCLDAGDGDDDGELGIVDAIWMLNYLFVPGSPDPLPPFPTCGNDPTPDSVSCLLTNSCPVDSAWSVAPPLPEAKGALVTEAVDGVIYSMGGADTRAGLEVTSTVQAFDSVSETWTTVAPVPDGSTWGATSAVVNGKIYVIGGWPGSGTLNRRYDPATDTWEALAPSPLSFKWGHACAVVGEEIHVMGGVPTGVGHRVYDTVTDTWSSRAALTVLAQRARAEFIEDRIYVVGTLTADLLIYDLDQDSWELGPNLPVPSEAPATLVRDGQLWVVGGATDDPETGGNLSAVQIFNPSTPFWSQGPAMPTCRSWAGAVLLNDDVHVLGGFDSQNNAVDAHEVLD